MPDEAPNLTVLQVAKVVLPLLLAAGALVLALRLRAFGRPTPPSRHAGVSEHATPLWFIGGGLFLIYLLRGSFLGDWDRRTNSIAMVVISLGMLALTAGVHAAMRWRHIEPVGVAGRLIPRAIVPALLASIFAIPITYRVSTASVRLWELVGADHASAHAMLTEMRDSPDPIYVAMLVLQAVVLVPILEELIFRGHLQTAIDRAIGRPGVAIIVPSAVFAMIHDWWSMPAIFALSVMMGVVYHRTQNLWAAILVHAGFNGLTTTLFLLTQR
jgi:membrane protease YdiL (CAAX protease family)